MSVFLATQICGILNTGELPGVLYLGIKRDGIIKEGKRYLETIIRG